MGPFGLNPEDLLRMLSGKASRTAVASLVDGEILASRKVSDLRRQLATLMEDEQLEKMTLIRNIHQRLNIPRDVEFSVNAEDFKIEMDDENFEKWERHLRSLGQSVPAM